MMALEQRKHDLRCQMVKLRVDRNEAQVIKVFAKLCEIKRAEAYLRRA
jgi:hypothetical protein